MRTRLGIFIICLSLFAVSVQAQQVEFNYEGRVRVDGLAYTGEAYFKFAIINASKTVALWSNDLSSVTGEKPLAAVPVDVNDGVFNVIIGDTDLTNMVALDPSSFNVRGRVFLRVWFSDVSTGPFEHLTPDRPITNPALLGSQSYSELDLYVDPVLGADENPGTDPTRPKKTIQAAWNALPPMIQEDATIHLADGIYRQETLLTGKTVIGDATIIISGNENNPDLVKISGANELSPTTPVRSYGFHIVNQKNLSIESIFFEYTFKVGYFEDGEDRGAGIFLDRDSEAYIKNCKFMNNDIGIRANRDSFVEAVNVECGLGTVSAYSRGIDIVGKSSGILRQCNIHDVYFGIAVNKGCRLEVYGSIADNNNQGYHIAFTSIVHFFPPLNTISNNQKGISATQYSQILRANDSTRVYYENNGTDTWGDGTEIFYE